MKLAAIVCRCSIFWGLAMLASHPGFAAEPYKPPATQRTDMLLDGPWRFIRQDVDGADQAGFDDSNWVKVRLPHT